MSNNCASGIEKKKVQLMDLNNQYLLEFDYIVRDTGKWKYTTNCQNVIHVNIDTHSSTKTSRKTASCIVCFQCKYSFLWGIFCHLSQTNHVTTLPPLD